MRCHIKTLGFTLLELLAVVAIVGVLSVILFPAGKALLERGRETKCVSNLRQTGAAIAAYASDNDGELPVNEHPDKGVRWYIMLNPYLGKSISASEGGWTAPSIFICPANDPKSPGTTFKIFLDFGYACNLALMPRFLPATSTYFPGPPVRMSALRGRRALVADTGTHRTLYFKSNPALAPYGTPVSRGYIHRGGVNVLWTDSSVSWMKAEEFMGPEGAAVSWY